MTSASPDRSAAAARPQLAHLARQPILDGKLRTVGYELLFRANATDNIAGVTDGTHATSTVLANALAEFGLETVVGALPAWVNFTAEYLTEGLPIPLGPKALVIELLEDAVPTPDLLERLGDLKRQGYRIALDDFIYRPELAELLSVANIVKIDIRNRDFDEIGQQVKLFTKHQVQLLAEKVETMQEYDRCTKLGFSLFQGYFVCKPELMHQKRTPANRVALMRLLSELFATDPNIDRIRQHVQQDVTLSYRLLKWLNSSLFSLPHAVESIQHAIIMLGLHRLRNLVSLIVLARIDDKPNELITTSLMRARVGENLASHFGVSPETMFTVGLFSVLDALISMPMTQILESMPLAPEISAAILERDGTCGRLLSGIEAHERGEWAGIEAAGLDLALLTPAWVDAAVWVRSVRSMAQPAGLGGARTAPAAR